MRYDWSFCIFRMRVGNKHGNLVLIVVLNTSAHGDISVLSAGVWRFVFLARIITYSYQIYRISVYLYLWGTRYTNIFIYLIYSICHLFFSLLGMVYNLTHFSPLRIRSLFQMHSGSHFIFCWDIWVWGCSEKWLALKDWHCYLIKPASKVILWQQLTGKNGSLFLDISCKQYDLCWTFAFLLGARDFGTC